MLLRKRIVEGEKAKCLKWEKVKVPEGPKFIFLKLSRHKEALP